MLRGVDLSHHQGAIDWAKLAPTIDFVFIKATQGQGPGFEGGKVIRHCFADGKFAEYRDQAKAHDLIRGYYHFALPSYVPYHDALDKAGGKAVGPDDYESDAAAQANFFCDTVGALEPGELDLVLDLEATKYGHGDRVLTADEMKELQEWTVTFVDTVKARYPGRTVIVYSYSAFLKGMQSSAAPFPRGLLSCPLWLAALANKGVGSPPADTTQWEGWTQGAPSPPHWSDLAFWQFSWKAHLEGMPSAKTEVDADLFLGTMADLRRLAHLDSLAYPLAVTAEEHYALNEGGLGGFYPIGANNFWHGGIHLDSDQALHAVAEGKLVAYRATKKPLEVTLGGAKLPLSNGFALTHHTRFTPKGAKIDFFTLYTHLLPLDDYTAAQKAAPPPLFSKPKFLVNTSDDGAGLAVRSADDQGAIVGIIPNGAHFEVTPTVKASWDPAAVKVKFGAIQGYAVLAERAAKVKGTTYRCNTVEDVPDAAGLGMNVREKGAGTRVTRVAPCGSVLDFKDPASVLKGGRLLSGWHLLKAGGSVCVRAGDQPNVTVELTLEGAEVDKVVKVDRPISTGIVLGYPGPYLTRPQTVHVEIFTNDVGFMKNPKGDKGGPTTLKIPAGTTFKKRKDIADELVQVNAPAGARLRILKKGEPHLQVAVDEIVGWTERATLGNYDSGSKKYTLTAALAGLLADLPVAPVEGEGDGEAAAPESLEIGGKPGDKLKLRLQSGEHRKVGYLLSQAERDKRTGWATAAELGKLDKSDDHYVLAAPLPTLHKKNPDCLHDLSEDAGQNATELLVDLLAIPNPAVIRDADGKIWQEAELSPGKKGWFQRDQKTIKALSAYDWPRWQRIQEHGGYSEDGLCDAADIVSLIDVDGDGEVTSKEIAAALKNPRVADKLRHLACLHPTEWSGELKGIERLSGAPWHLDKEGLDATKDYIKKLGFWSEISADGLPTKDKVWHLHPIGFLEHLSRLTLLAAAPAPAPSGATGSTEIFLLCGHEIDKSPRCVRDKKGIFEIVATVKKGKDRITLLHRDSLTLSPESLLVEFPGGKLEAKAEGEEGAEYTRYGFDCEHKGPDNYNIFSGEFWQRLFGATTYTIKNLSRPISVVAYPPHKWKLSIKFPSMRGLKMGTKLEKDYKLAVGRGGVSAELQKKTFSAELEQTGWKKDKSTSSVEMSTASKQQAALNQYSDPVLKSEDKPDGAKVKSVSLKRDDTEISLDKVPSLKSLLAILKVATGIFDIIKKIQENVPKVGWYAELEVQVLQGKLGLEWQWKEHKDHRAFLWMKAGFEMTLFSVALEIGVGVSGLSFKAQIFAKIEGSVEVSLSAERSSPDAVDVVPIPLKGAITGTVGARFEAGELVKIEATLETALELEGSFKLNTESGFSVKLTPKWTGLKGKVTASAGFGGWKGNTEASHTFIEEQEFNLIEWPKDEPYNPEYVTRERVQSIVREELISWWGGVRVFSGDRQWTENEIVEKVTAKIDARQDIRRDARSVEGLVHDIGQRLERLKKSGWTGDYIEAAQFNLLISGGEADRLMTKSYIDPCKDVLNKLGP